MFFVRFEVKGPQILPLATDRTSYFQDTWRGLVSQTSVPFQANPERTKAQKGVEWTDDELDRLVNGLDFITNEVKSLEIKLSDNLQYDIAFPMRTSSVYEEGALIAHVRAQTRHVRFSSLAQWRKRVPIYVAFKAAFEHILANFFGSYEETSPPKKGKGYRADKVFMEVIAPLSHEKLLQQASWCRNIFSSILNCSSLSAPSHRVLHFRLALESLRDEAREIAQNIARHILSKNQTSFEPCLSPPGDVRGGFSFVARKAGRLNTTGLKSWSHGIWSPSLPELKTDSNLIHTLASRSSLISLPEKVSYAGKINFSTSSEGETTARTCVQELVDATRREMVAIHTSQKKKVLEEFDTWIKLNLETPLDRLKCLSERCLNLNEDLKGVQRELDQAQKKKKTRLSWNMESTFRTYLVSVEPSAFNAPSSHTLKNEKPWIEDRGLTFEYTLPNPITHLEDGFRETFRVPLVSPFLLCCHSTREAFDFIFSEKMRVTPLPSQTPPLFFKNLKWINLLTHARNHERNVD